MTDDKKSGGKQEPKQQPSQPQKPSRPIHDHGNTVRQDSEHVHKTTDWNKPPRKEND